MRNKPTFWLWRERIVKVVFTSLTFLSPFLMSSLPLCCRAEDRVSLLIWVQDTGSFAALTKQKFEAALKNWKDLEVGPIRSVFIEAGHSHDLVGRINEAILPSDKISNLIIASHGSTSLRENKVRLQDLGEFGEQGSSGLFHELLEHIGPYLTNELNISLQACSTACGTKDQIASRINGLQKELSAFGVQRLSVWGARQPLAFDDHYHPVSNKESKAQLRSVVKKLVGFSIFSGVTLGAVAFTMLSNLNYDYESLKTALMIAGSNSAFTFGALYGLLYSVVKGTDMKGYLVISEDGENQILEVDSGKSDAVHSTKISCARLLEAK